MPIRIEDVPNLTGDDGFHIPRMRPEVAAAPAKALGSVAESIASVGEAFHGIARQTQNQVNQKQILETQSGWSRDAAALQAQRDQEPDPVRRVQMTNDFIARQRATVENPAFAPVVRQALEQSFQPFSDRISIGGGVSAARAPAEQLRQTGNEALKNAKTAGEVQTIFTYLSAGGVASKGDEAKAQAVHKEKIDAQNHRASAEADPYLYMEEHGGFGEANPDLRRAQYLELARKGYSNELVKTVTDLHSAVATSGIVNGDQLNGWLGDRISPAAKSACHDFLSQTLHDMLDQQAHDPAFQAQLIGQISPRIGSYHIGKPGFDQEYVGIRNQIARLPAGATRDELEKNLEDARTGQSAEASSNMGRALAELDTTYAAGGFGSKPSSHPLASFLSSGFISPENMKEAGFSWDQLQEIDGEPTMQGKIDKVAKYLDQRPYQPAATITPLKEATWKAIAGPNPVGANVEWQEKGQAEAAARTYGGARKSLMDWARLNPDDARDFTKVENQKREVISPGALEKLSQAIIGRQPPAPPWRQGASGNAAKNSSNNSSSGRP